MITYTFDEFSYVDRPIMIPKETVFYRGISKRQAIEYLQILRPNVPIYIASKHVADAYARGKDDLMVCLRLVRNARLIDVRKAISILPVLLGTVKHDETNKKLVDILKLTLGISSIHEQIALFKLAGVHDASRLQRLEDFSKVPRLLDGGVRCPITNYDNTMVLVLKQLLSTYYDGFISPRLETPFEPDGKSHSEIVLFDSSLLEIVRDEDPDVSTTDIRHTLGVPTKMGFANVYKSGGQKGGKRTCEDRNLPFENEEWVKKTSFLIEKQLGRLAIKPELWDHSYSHVWEKHMTLPDDRLAPSEKRLA